MAIALCVLVTLTVASEFYRGGRVISKHTGQGMFASMVQLTHRNTRRYGGYIVTSAWWWSSSALPGRPSISTKSRRWDTATR